MLRSLTPILLGTALFLARPAFAAAALAPPASSPLPNMVHIGPAGQGTDAFVAWPAGNASAPALIMVHEWWGLEAEIRDMARKLSRQGYVVIIPDLYHGRAAQDPERAHELMRGLEDSRVSGELDAARAWLRGQPRCEKSRIGVIGFCMGGGYALRFALRGGDLAAAVMFYGAPETDVDKLAGLKAPLLGHFGGEDEGIGADRVDAFRSALQKAGKVAEIHVYRGAGHAFMNESRPSFHPDAARVAWARTLAFFQKYLKH